MWFRVNLTSAIFSDFKMVMIWQQNSCYVAIDRGTICESIAFTEVVKSAEFVNTREDKPREWLKTLNCSEGAGRMRRGWHIMRFSEWAPGITHLFNPWMLTCTRCEALCAEHCASTSLAVSQMHCSSNRLNDILTVVSSWTMSTKTRWIQ